MTKIMLVEDDKSLREIYGVRLLAEGYDIVTAGDGEEALAMAIKERPSLIIADVMMPRISGFDMLDILRSTTETRSIKVIMMTALSSEEHRQRGEAMGADRYLVKSQVGIEDVVRVVHEVLGDSQAATPTPQQAPTQQTSSPAVPPRTTQPQSAPQVPQRSQAPTPPPAPRAAQNQTQPMQPETPSPQPQPMRPTPPASAATQPGPPRQMSPSSTTPTPPSVRQRIIQPLNAPSKVNINELLDRELAKEAGVNIGTPAPQVAASDQERAIVQNQLESLNEQPSPQPVPQPAPTTTDAPITEPPYEPPVAQNEPPQPPLQTPRAPIQPPERPAPTPQQQPPIAPNPPQQT